jgi:hypothetical protein
LKKAWKNATRECRLSFRLTHGSMLGAPTASGSAVGKYLQVPDRAHHLPECLRQ